ncbi:MAG TPA: AEC family transporter [Candidatus Sulfotelmatobacter sp.]|nr:AEC family transporter [Candidatus Sulfotelmatobacter sp.]
MIFELVSGLAAVVAPAFLVSLAGFVWQKRRLPFDQVQVTNMITLVGAPCLVFSTLTKAHLPSSEIMVMGGATLACLGLSAAVGVVALRFAKLPLKVYLPSLVFPNIGNLGLPVCLFAFGDEGMALAMIFFAVTTVGQFTLGPAIASGQFQAGQLLRVPFMYAALVSLLLGAMGIQIPRWLANSADLAGSLTVPLMLLALGVALAELKAANFGRAVVMSVARLALGVLGGWLVSSLMGLEGVHRGVVIIESAMPVAVFNFLFARMYGNQPDEVAGMVLVSTVLAFLGLPVLVALLI